MNIERLPHHDQVRFTAGMGLPADMSYAEERSLREGWLLCASDIPAAEDVDDEFGDPCAEVWPFQYDAQLSLYCDALDRARGVAVPALRASITPDEVLVAEVTGIAALPTPAVQSVL